MFRFFLHCLLSNRKPPIAREPYSFGRRDHRLGCGPLLELAMRAGRRRRSGFPRESDDSESPCGVIRRDASQPWCEKNCYSEVCR